MQNSAIEWTTHSFNPWWGCQRVSPGCQHCYAETLAKRYGHAVWGPAKTTDRRMMSENYWRQPLKWNAAAANAADRPRVFCASMADVFEDHPGVVEARARLFDLIIATPNLDWQLLTKRPENMTRFAPPSWSDGWPLNVWAMTSVESQEQADTRIPELLQVPARVRGLSCEPLLGAVDLSEWLPDLNTPINNISDDDAPLGVYDPLTRERYPDPADIELHWVIVGGESGHGARPMHPDWARSLRDQCAAAEVAFHFKQHGEYCPGEFQRSGVMSGYWQFQQGSAFHEESHGPPEDHLWHGAPDGEYRFHTVIRPWPDVACVKLGKLWSGRMLDGREWNELPVLKPVLKPAL
jgi:protein gp37